MVTVPAQLPDTPESVAVPEPLEIKPDGPRFSTAPIGLRQSE